MCPVHGTLSSCLLVTWYWSPGVLDVVGVDGQVVRSYMGRMKYPASLAVTKNDNILVADRHNDRILSINSLLNSTQELTLPVDGGIHRPSCLYLDESRGRLYVADCGPVGLSPSDGLQRVSMTLKFSCC